jgi:hypothetical protein
MKPAFSIAERNWIAMPKLSLVVTAPLPSLSSREPTPLQNTELQIKASYKGITQHSYMYMSSPITAVARIGTS